MIFISSMRHPFSINELYVFGDSLSDVGNSFQATGGTSPPSPPYFQGRYSNGPVWVEQLATELHLPLNPNTNFAYGGATTGHDISTTSPSLLAQVQQFVSSHPRNNSNGLYIIWIGSNDYLQGLTNPEQPIANLSAAIAALAKVGAQKILVGNLPNLGSLPATRTTIYSNALNLLTNTHNRGLAQALSLLEQQLTNVQIIQLNVNALYQDAISHPAKYGFSNVTSACLAQSAVCVDPQQFLFWDDIHPTTAAHQILGKAAFELLQDEQPISFSLEKARS